MIFFFSSRRRHTRLQGDWSSDVCSSDLGGILAIQPGTVLLLSAGVSITGTNSTINATAAPGNAIYFLPADGTTTWGDRKSVVWGKSVDLGGRRIIKKKKKESVHRPLEDK